MMRRMLEGNSAGTVRGVAVLALTVLLAACGGGGGSSSSGDGAAPPPTTPPPTGGGGGGDTPTVTVDGSVGDGPVTGATVRAVTLAGAVVATATSDERARFSIDIPADAAFPLLLEASGGTDTVTLADPDFTMTGIVVDADTVISNITPLSSLVLAAASCSDTALTGTSLVSLTDTVLGAIGLEVPGVQDIFATDIGAGNVAEVVVVNEMAGEVLRRVRNRAGGNRPFAELIEVLGCDLADGRLDGSGGTADAALAGIALTTTAEVLLEGYTGVLTVNGLPAAAAIDAAMRVPVPNLDAAVTMRGVRIPQSALDLVRVTLVGIAADAADPELAVRGAAALDTLAAALTPASLGSSLPAGLGAALTSEARRVANATPNDAAAVTGAYADLVDATGSVALTLSTSAAEVPSGGSATLTWSAEGASLCRASGGWSGLRDPSGSEAVQPPDGATLYSLECIGGAGADAQDVAIVTEGTVIAIPTVTLTASVDSVDFNGTVRLDWSTTNALQCSATGDWLGNKGTSGSEVVGPLQEDSEFRLQCTGVGGAGVDVVAVDVGAAPLTPVLVFAADETMVPFRGGTTLRWTATAATGCTATGAWSGSRAVAGEEDVDGIEEVTTYVLTCSGPAGSTEERVVLIPGDPPNVGLTLTADPGAVDFLGATTLRWSTDLPSPLTAGDVACEASGGWTGPRLLSGAEVVPDLVVDTAFTLTCTGPGNAAVATANVTVAPGEGAPPTLTFDGSPRGYGPLGAAVTLEWESSDAQTCDASGDWAGSRGLSGQENVGTLLADGLYILTCRGAGGLAEGRVHTTVRTATLTWAAPLTNEDGSTLADLAGYRVYIGQQSNSYDTIVDIDNPLTLQYMTDLEPGDWFFNLTAVDASGNESAFAGEVVRTVF